MRIWSVPPRRAHFIRFGSVQFSTRLKHSFRAAERKVCGMNGVAATGASVTHEHFFRFGSFKIHHLQFTLNRLRVPSNAEIFIHSFICEHCTLYTCTRTTQYGGFIYLKMNIGRQRARKVMWMRSSVHEIR